VYGQPVVLALAALVVGVCGLVNAGKVSFGSVSVSVIFWDWSCFFRFHSTPTRYYAFLWILSRFSLYDSLHSPLEI
jgi:hypothetical protein